MEYGNWLIKKKITLRSNRNIKLVLCFNKKALVIHPWHDDAIVPPLNVFFEPNIRNLIGIVNELLGRGCSFENRSFEFSSKTG
jgi:hypothetical protein